MGVETSNKKTEPSNLSNMVFAIGERKEKSYGPALSLQDVFSESENSLGLQQETSCLFNFEQGVRRNLREICKKNTSKYLRILNLPQNNY